ncbi:MAG: hypothetical protein L0Y58_24505 [Verrucomicrobia subdivision 3 bacterium]|nr:hypothetical protein [Limisphaerales bacterium]
MEGRAPSSYYPPRAGRLQRAHTLAYSVRTRLRLEELNHRLGTTVSRFVLALAMPGYSFLDAGWKAIGIATLAGWAVALCAFFIWLGYGAADVAFGLLISMHVSSVIYLFNRVASEMGVVRRLLFSLGLLFMVSQAVYVPARNWLEEKWIVPVRKGEKIYVIDRRATTSLKRGELVACKARGVSIGGVGSAPRIYIRDGLVVDRILGLPHDEVTFGPGFYSVNGVVAPALGRMPSSGSFTVPGDKWLVWPSLSTVTEYNVDRERIAAAVLEMAMVSSDQLLGRPFRHWFWRDQTQ